jgi:DNA-binding NarL/FixJ family response regulator
MAYSRLLIIDARSSLFTVRVALEQRYDIAVSHAKDAATGLKLMHNSPPDCILVNPREIETEVATFLTQLTQMGKDTPVIVVGDDGAVNRLRSVYPHVVGYVPPVYNESDLMPFLRRQRPTQTGRLRGMALAERAALVQTNQLLERRVQEMLTLYQIGKAVASLTDLDVILARIVEAAVYLLRAEEGSIMLVDPETNELYLRAEKGLGEKQAQGFNVKIKDTLIGSVVRTGRPVTMARGTSDDTRLKVVTGYLVNALLYVPLTLRGQVMGVLGVANQTAPKAFTEHDQRLIEALADYAALAIEVARQHKAFSRFRQDLAVAHTIAATVKELREQVATNDPNILSALRRIEGAAHILTRMAEAEAQVDV